LTLIEPKNGKFPRLYLALAMIAFDYSDTLQVGHVNTETLDLVSASWLPVIRASGQRERTRPAELTDRIDSDPIVDLDFPRADFRVAVLELLIGLLTVACPPGDDWEERWAAPPASAELDADFGPFAAILTIDGKGPRAFQDFEDFAAEPTSVEALLIEAPGAAGVKKNTALLVKAGRVEIMSRCAAATALLTLQTMAPAGGAGHRTSLRGGGPLTTLVVPARPTTLWHLLWANVPPGGARPTPSEFPRIFPWLGPTRLSNKDGRTTTPEDVDWRQAFFGMPRRLRLNFEPNIDRLRCDLTGEIDNVIVRTYRIRPHGTNYEAWGGIHPLTPHYRSKAGDLVLNPVHGQNDRIGYREWMAMLYGAKDGLRYPAASVAHFLSVRKGDLPKQDRSFRLMAAGYDMDNMKARSFTEGETPDIVLPSDEGETVAEQTRNFVAAASNVASALGQAIKIALYSDGADVDASSTPLTTARDRFWADTNDAFFEMLNRFSLLPAKELQAEAGTDLGKKWRGVLELSAFAIFDEITPIQDALSPNVKRVVDGRRSLMRTLRGDGPRGVELFKNLRLPVPEAKIAKGKAA
jgi:CRISPR system Cascade subunit CasA